MRPLRHPCEVAIIGGGVAGLSAASHAMRLGHSVTLFERSPLFGGQIATIDAVEGLAVPGHFSGQALAVHLLEEARKGGVRVLETEVEQVLLSGQMTLLDEQHHTYHPKAIIVASGASLRKLGVPNEDAFLGRGWSQCATCDGGFFRDQDVVVVGGGDAAVQEALLLTRTSRQVFLVCRGDLRAKKEYKEKLAAKQNVTFIWDCEITDILGTDGVTGVRLRNVTTDKTTELACSGVFPFVGATPNTKFLPPELLTDTRHIRIAAGVQTPVQNLFAVGAVRESFGGNIVQAMSDGIDAAEAI